MVLKHAYNDAQASMLRAEKERRGMSFVAEIQVEPVGQQLPLPAFPGNVVGVELESLSAESLRRVMR